jgi:hypothetical protein
MVHRSGYLEGNNPPRIFSHTQIKNMVGDEFW